MTVWDDDPAHAELEGHVVYRWQELEPGGDGTILPVAIRAVCLQTSTATEFELRIELVVDLEGRRFFERTWQERIPRRFT
jgi:hypothetical protein